MFFPCKFGGKSTVLNSNPTENFPINTRAFWGNYDVIVSQLPFHMKGQQRPLFNLVGLVWMVKGVVPFTLYFKSVLILNCSYQISPSHAPSSCVSKFFEGCTRGMTNLLLFLPPSSCTVGLALGVKHLVLINVKLL